MSTIAQIRDAVATVLDSVVLGSEKALNSTSGYPPDNVGALPIAFCGLASKGISYTAGTKDNEWTLQVVVLLERVPDMLTPEIKALEVLMEALEAAFESNISLGDRVSIALLGQIDEETIEIARQPYLGFIATLNVTDKFEIALTD